LAAGFLVLGLAALAQNYTEQDQAEFAAAKKLLEGGDAKGAEAAFTGLLGRFPENPNVLYLRAVARNAQEKFQAAIDDLDVLITFQPQLPDPYLLRAEARAGLKNFAGALADANLAVRLVNGDNPQVLATRARILQATGKPAEAVADYTAALKLDADNPDLRFERADLQVSLGDIEAAHPDLTRLAQEYPDHGPIWLRLADVEFSLRHWPETLQALERAQALNADSGQIARTRGLTLFAQGDFKGAIVKLQEALKAEPTRNAYPQLMIHLAQRRSGQPAPDLKPAIDGMESKWAQLIGYFLLGELKDTELLETAEGKADPVLKKGHTCEAYYYMGQMRLLAGDRIAAKALFQQAVATDAKSYDEWALAQAELGK
jgi:tetratricopeptide (TPR) repeat protein